MGVTDNESAAEWAVQNQQQPINVQKEPENTPSEPEPNKLMVCSLLERN